MTTTLPGTRKISNYLVLGNAVLLDGGLATFLETLGADISGALWSADILLKQPALVKQTHLEYFRAGANIAITASYQASVPGLVKHLNITDEQAKEVVRKSVKIAHEAREEFVAETLAKLSQTDEEEIVANGSTLAEYEQSIRGRLFIAGSVGPYGAYLANGSEYRGDYNVAKEDMKAFHRGRIEALIDAGVDVLACETMPSKAEIEALLELLRTEFAGTEAYFSFTLKNGEHISDGTPLTDVAPLFYGIDQVVAQGFNCVSDDVALLAAIKVYRPLMTRGTLLVYPNSGELWNAEARQWEGRIAEGSSLAEKTLEWWTAGAGIVGGCCGTAPKDIEVMRKALKAFI